MTKNSTKLTIHILLENNSAKNAMAHWTTGNRYSYMGKPILKKEYKNLIKTYANYKKFDFTVFSEVE